MTRFESDDDDILHIKGPFDLPYAKPLTIGTVVLLAVIVLYAAVSMDKTGPATPPPPTVPAQTLTQAGVAEQLLTLPDGRTLTCLSFPTPAVSCDWGHATLTPAP